MRRLLRYDDDDDDYYYRLTPRPCRREAEIVPTLASPPLPRSSAARLPPRFVRRMCVCASRPITGCGSDSHIHGAAGSGYACRPASCCCCCC